MSRGKKKNLKESRSLTKICTCHWMATLLRHIGELKVKKEESVEFALLSKNPAGRLQTGKRCV